MDLKRMQELCFEGSAANGWWGDDPASADVQAAFAEKIALMHSELSEALEAFREGHPVAERYFRDENGSVTYMPLSVRGKLNKPEGVPSELADVVIRVLDFCGAAGIDLNAVIIEKLRYNETRGFKHGGKAI